MIRKTLRRRLFIPAGGVIVASWSPAPQLHHIVTPRHSDTEMLDTRPDLQLLLLLLPSVAGKIVYDDILEIQRQVIFRLAFTCRQIEALASLVALSGSPYNYIQSLLQIVSSDFRFLKYVKNFPKVCCIIYNESVALCLSNADGFLRQKSAYSTQKGGGYCYTKFYSLHKNTAFDPHQILFSHINLRILWIFKSPVTIKQQKNILNKQKYFRQTQYSICPPSQYVMVMANDIIIS